MSASDAAARHHVTSPPPRARTWSATAPSSAGHSARSAATPRSHDWVYRASRCTWARPRPLSHVAESGRGWSRSVRVTSLSAPESSAAAAAMRAASAASPGDARWGAVACTGSRYRPTMARPRGAKTRAAEVLRLLTVEYPDVRCALVHRNAFELLTATILSAQTTDERVNMVTPTLFANFPTARDLAAADPEKVEELIRST